MKRLVLLLAFFAILIASIFCQNNRPLLAVLPLNCGAGVSRELADSITDLLEVKIEQTGLYTMVERREIDRLLKEMEFYIVISNSTMIHCKINYLLRVMQN